MDYPCHYPYIKMTDRNSLYSNLFSPKNLISPSEYLKNNITRFYSRRSLLERERERPLLLLLLLLSPPPFSPRQFHPFFHPSRNRATTHRPFYVPPPPDHQLKHATFTSKTFEQFRKPIGAHNAILPTQNPTIK